MWTGLLAGAGGGWLTGWLTKAGGGQLNRAGDGWSTVAQDCGCGKAGGGQLNRAGDEEVGIGVGVRIGEGVGVRIGVD